MITEVMLIVTIITGYTDEGKPIPNVIHRESMASIKECTKAAEEFFEQDFSSFPEEARVQGASANCVGRWKKDTPA